jgi:hypothetical protein
MGNNSEDSWIKDLGTIWFMCIFIGVFTGGVGLIITIPIAIGCTTYAFLAEITGKKSQPAVSTHYLSYGGVPRSRHNGYHSFRLFCC